MKASNLSFLIHHFHYRESSEWI